MRKTHTIENLGTKMNKKQDCSEEQSIVLSRKTAYGAEMLEPFASLMHEHCDEFSQF